MLATDVLLDHVPLTDACSVALHRTLHVPDDGTDHPLPPSLGRLPVLRVDAGTFVVPLRRAEATWLSFQAPSWRPRALKVGAGGVCAVTGEPFVPDVLDEDGPQAHVVIPDQPWLDGFKTGEGVVRQFVAVPLGEGLTVEAQLTGREREGGLELSLFEPRPGRFPDEPPAFAFPDVGDGVVLCCAPSACEPMGLAAGGSIRQEVHLDDHGPGTWEPTAAAAVRVELVDALAFEALTGLELPGPPVDARTYTEHGLPWFDLLAPTHRDLEAAERLRGIRSIADLEGRRDEPLPIPEHQVRRLLALRTAA